jgi:hypothetical protein
VADCYQDDFARSAAVFQQRGMGDLRAGHDVVNRQFSRAKAFSSLCAQYRSDSYEIRRFMCTASAARDMLALVDLIEELRKGRTPSPIFNLPQTPLLQQYPPEETRIQYLGFSNDTILGNIFASMYRGRIGRMILDGVADAVDYVKGVRSS